MVGSKIFLARNFLMRRNSGARMPNGLMRTCAGGCGALVRKGRCLNCQRETEARRRAIRLESYGAECSYHTTVWRKLRARFRRELSRADIFPTCGARLPGAPITDDSRCQADGVLITDTLHKLQTGHELHVDHIVPHRGDKARWRDLLNLSLLWANCHNRKSQREGQRCA
jgi:hypothetical protein